MPKVHIPTAGYLLTTIYLFWHKTDPSSTSFFPPPLQNETKYSSTSLTPPPPPHPSPLFQNEHKYLNQPCVILHEVEVHLPKQQGSVSLGLYWKGEAPPSHNQNKHSLSFKCPVHSRHNCTVNNTAVIMQSTANSECS